MKSKAWMLGLIALAGDSAAAESDFAPYVARVTGSSAEAITVGDVNADGRDDIVLATGFNFDAANDGDGTHDVAWRNSATGENVVWKSANAHTPLDITDITNLQWKVQP